MTRRIGPPLESGGEFSEKSCIIGGMSADKFWYAIKNPEKVSSPALLIYPDRIRRNIELMIEIAGDVKRLRPHVKTHKMPELVALQVSYGIRKFKCSTIAEAEMTARSGGEDILLAYQPAGPQIERFLRLIQAFPEKVFSTLVDNPITLDLISRAAEKRGVPVRLYVDIDNGMHRTGIGDEKETIELIQHIGKSPGLEFSGLHVYDGHIQKTDPVLREEQCRRDFEPVLTLVQSLKKQGIEVKNLVAGGSPTFPVHARFKERDLSPGTTLLWDKGYSSSFADLGFLHAAVILSRVVSKPQKVNLCLDLGYKAVSADKPHPRIFFPEIENYRVLNHSEEHLVIVVQTDLSGPGDAGDFETGDVLYGIPVHICPTVALYEKALVVENHQIIDEWTVRARNRKLTI